ncbi:MAG: hypothetical protein ACK40G_09575 [Cytophagaceae bacterium]
MKRMLLFCAVVLMSGACMKVKDPLYDCPDFSAKKKPKVKHHQHQIQIVEIKEKQRPRFENRDL